MSASLRHAAVAALLATTLLAASSASATGFDEHGRDLRPREQGTVDVSGYLRLRGEALRNLDLDRGVDTSGQPFFPVPLADPAGQTLRAADLRLRADLAAFAPGGLVSVKLRVDVLDGLALGGTPLGDPPDARTPTPAASPGQQPPETAFRVKRAYGEALTPLGVLAAGRMGSHFGLGLMANGGDCPDCDGGDSADRIAFVTPVLSHLWAFAYDFSSSGPTTARSGESRVVDLEPTDDVRTFTFALLRVRTDEARARRRNAGKATFEYGAAASHRTQENDVPASYLAVATPVALDERQVMGRGYSATALDAWARLTLPKLRVEAEAAVLLARIEQASLVPGVELRGAVEGTAFGGALESELGAPEDAFGFGLDGGFASGDPAPGFAPDARAAGNDPRNAPPRPGELHGAQAYPPHDLRADDFRFHPDYRVDRILFRELVGTVTDAVYLRPHLRLRLFEHRAATLTAELAAVGSRAVEPSSTPSGKAPLGLELDPTLVYEDGGLVAALEHAVLFPLAGLDNEALGLSAKPAQLFRARLAYRF